MTKHFLLVFFATAALNASADWRISSAFDQRQNNPPRNYAEGQPIKPGDTLPNSDKFHWLLGELAVPEVIDGKPMSGLTVGMQINGGDGGEVWVNEHLQGRYDNDHPALAVLADNAQAGTKVRVAVQLYGKVQGGDKFDQAN